MSADALIQHYGLLAVLLGAGVEGEAVVVAGGAFAQKGLVRLAPACVAAAAGAFVVDQAWFFAGRHFRDHRRVRAITRRPTFARAVRVFERRPTPYVFGFRFVYGMRTVSPIVIGTSDYPTRRFVALNMLAAMLWGPAFTLLGYGFGAVVERVVGRVAHGALVVLGAVVVAGVLVAVVRLGREWSRSRTARRRGPGRDDDDR